MIVWVLFRGFMILVHFFMFKCYNFMYLYTNVCVSTLSCGSIMFQTWSIDLRSYYPGPLLPSSLASQDYMVWYLRCVAAQPFLNVWYGFSYNLGSVFYAPFFSIRDSFILWNTWSILYRLYSNLIMSLLGHSFGAKLVSHFSGQCLAFRLASQLASFI